MNVFSAIRYSRLIRRRASSVGCVSALAEALPVDQLDTEPAAGLLVEPLPVQQLAELLQACAAKLVALLPGRKSLRRHVKSSRQPRLVLADLAEKTDHFRPEAGMCVGTCHNQDPGFAENPKSTHTSA